MEKLVSNQALIYVAHLTVPTSQEIVINANLGCACCRERLHRIMMRITGLREYKVDVRNSQVIMRGNLNVYETLKNKTRKTHSLRRSLVRWITQNFN
ncbi:unnamed protein product [Lactuca virosa]|uniref:HMA domain-containing protein n=1 Tax=Lactuca virosa TaxID=75947 RepID=A0AAU9PVW1_9ASTR|nr:unnamed protein product [Lactuca virosa]